jgi:hypothetical protein
MAEQQEQNPGGSNDNDRLAGLTGIPASSRAGAEPEVSSATAFTAEQLEMMHDADVLHQQCIGTLLV